MATQKEQEEENSTKTVKKLEASNSVKSSKKNYFTLLLFLLFLILFSYLSYIGFKLDQNVGFLQEQVDYMQERHKTTQDSMNRLSSRIKELGDKITEHEFTHTVTKPKEPNIEEAAPFDHIKENEIRVAGNWFSIQNRQLSWAKYLDTKSMEPTISSSVNGIEVIPKKTDDIHVGDIISYSYDNIIIVHRVTKIGTDEKGWYAITKGDNARKEDPIKVRFDQIQGLLIGLIY